MIYAIIWAVCGLLALAFFWEVIRLAAASAIGAALICAVGGFAAYMAAVHGHALLCAVPWASDAIMWGLLPLGAAAYWMAGRRRTEA